MLIFPRMLAVLIGEQVISCRYALWEGEFSMIAHYLPTVAATLNPRS